MHRELLERSQSLLDRVLRALDEETEIDAETAELIAELAVDIEDYLHPTEAN